MTEDAILEIIFKTSDDGGRKSPVSGEYYGCPLLIDGEGFECRFILHGKILDLGIRYTVSVKFMNKDLVLKKFKIGMVAKIWEGKDVGDAKLIDIL